LSDEEKLDEALKFKDSGTESFKAKNYEVAILAYDEAIKLSDGCAIANEVWLTCKSNAAQAYLNLENYEAAVAYLSSVLKKDKQNIKALYRRGLARNRLGESEKALKDLTLASNLDPNNEPVKVELIKAKSAVVSIKKRVKDSYSKAFSNQTSVYNDKPAIVKFGVNCPKVDSHTLYV
jgi:peptidylprolyl isomerase